MNLLIYCEDITFIRIFRVQALSNPLPNWEKKQTIVFCYILNTLPLLPTSFLPSSLLSSLLSSTPTAPPSLPLF